MKVIIVGIGRMGTGLSLKLIKKGHQVTVIDSNPEVFEALGDDFKGTKVVGFGFDRDVLTKAEINNNLGICIGTLPITSFVLALTAT